MKKAHKKVWLGLAGTVAGAFMLRTIKLAYGRNRVRKLLGATIGDEVFSVKLDQALVDTLPKTSFDWRGRPTESINFLFLGSEDQLVTAFGRAGWLHAVPINAGNWAKAFWAGLRRGSYPTAPMTPYYVSTTPQDLSLQKETQRRSCHERHHIRLWRTNFRLRNKTEIWLGMASFDTGLKLINGFRFPYHHIDPNLDAERELVVRDLIAAGGREHKRFRLTDELHGVNDHKEPFYTDGKIVTVDVTGVTP